MRRGTLHSRGMTRGLAARFALLALPGVWLLARTASLGDPRALPRVAFVLLLFQLATLPLANAITRRYEAEADDVGLRLTRDGRSAEALYRRFARTSLTDPDPPRGALDRLSPTEVVAQQPT